jgi:hypothetical protein
MATDPGRRNRGRLVGLGVLFGVVVCASLGAAFAAASGEGPGMMASEGACCGVVLGALFGSVAARRSQ